MPTPDAPPLTRAVVLRGLGFGVAIALGAVAVWLIVIADSTKSMRLGVLAGIWGALLGAYSMFGARRHGLEDDEPRARSLSELPAMSAQEIAMRSSGEVERIAEAAARRAFEDRLEQMMRREISREVGDLRGEIARLRQDLLDKVGGQLRLERIETTRVIGSDLEALQHEVRQLKQASETGLLHELGIGGGPQQRVVVEPAKVRPVSRAAAEAAADIQPARAADQDAPVAELTRAAEPARTDPPAPVAPVPPAAPPVAPHAAPAQPPVPEPAGQRPAAPVRSFERPAAGATVVGGASPNGVSSNGVSSNGVSTNGGSSNGAAPNGVSTNGAAPGGVSTNGAGGRPQAPRAAAAPAPAETTGPIRVQPSGARPHASEPPTRPQAPSRPHAAPSKPAETWSPPAPPAVLPPTSAPPAAAAPPPAPASPPPPSRSADPFASLPRITPFTEFELDPVDTTPPPAPERPLGQASPVAPANSAYTGRRRRTEGQDADAGRHSRHDVPEPPAAPTGRRRRVDDDADDEDLLSRLLARGSAEH